MTPAPCRSILFVPATRPDRLARAATAGADAICIDLEDSVAREEKTAARANLVEQLAELAAFGVRSIVRINPLTRPEGLRDMLALTEMHSSPDGLFLPKCESADAVRWSVGLLGDRCCSLGVMPTIESPTGLSAVEAIAGASPRVSGIGFGSADYSTAIGSDMGWDALAYARGRIAAAAGQNGIAAIDGAWLAYKDDDGLRGEAMRVASMGFAGKMAIHPRQVSAINQAFSPSEEALTHAHRIIAAAAAAGGGVMALDGQMIDDPVVQAAQRTISASARAAAAMPSR